LINYFRSYSRLGDDRFFVSPCIINRSFKNLDNGIDKFAKNKTKS